MAKPVILRFVGDTSSLEAALKKAGLSAQVLDQQGASLGQRMAAAGATMTSVGGKLTRNVTVPMGLAAGAATKLAVDFESSMSKMVSLVGISQGQVDQWAKEIMDLGPQLGRAPAELADALYFVTSSGIAAADAMEVLKASGRASAVGLGETEVVADAVTSAMNAYGKENLSAAKATDILLATVKEGKGEPEDLAESIGRVIAPAQSLGVEFEEVGAALASMTLVGLDADEATTALRGALMALTNPTAEQSAALKEMGLDLEGVRKVIAEKGLLTGFQMLRDRMGENVEAGTALFGNVRALNGFMIMTGENSANTARIFDSLANSTGAVDQAFSVASQTAEFKLNAALSELKAAGIEAGAAIMPAVLGIAKTVAGVANAFADLDPPVQQAILAMVGFAAAAGPVITIAGRATQAFRAMGVAAQFLAMSSASASVAMTGIGIAAVGGAVGVGLMIKQVEAVNDASAELEDSQYRAINAQALGTRVQKDAAIAAFMHGRELASLATEQDKAARQYQEALAPAVREAKRVLDDLSDSTGISRERLAELATELGINLANMTEEARSKLTAAVHAIGRAVTPTERLEDVTETLGSATATTAEQFDAFKEALDAALGVTVDADEATLRLREKFEELGRVMKENGTQAGFLTEKERAVMGATLEATRAIEAEVEAYVKDGRISAEAGAQKAELVRRLEELRATYPTLTPVIDGYIAKIQAIPDEKGTTIKADVQQAIFDVERYKAALARIPTQAFTRANFNPQDVIEGRASGGPINGRQTYLVGEEGPELVTFDRPGMVYPADVTAALMKGGIIPRAEGGRVGPFLDADTGVLDHMAFEKALSGTAKHIMEGQNASRTGLGFAINLSAFVEKRDPQDELERVGRAYAQLALRVDEETAKQLLAQTSTADEYEEASRRIIQTIQERQSAEERAAQEAVRAAEEAARERKRAAEELARALEFETAKRMEIEDNQYAFGVLSKERYLEILDQRIAGEEAYTNEWAMLMRTRQSLAQENFQEELEIARNQWQMGQISKDQYLAALDRQMGATKKFSDEWMRLQNTRRTVELSVLASQDPGMRDRLDRGLGDYIALPPSASNSTAPSGPPSVEVASGAVQVHIQIDGGGGASVGELAERVHQDMKKQVIAELVRSIRARR